MERTVRLSGSAKFEAVFAYGRKDSGKVCVVRCGPNGLGYPRLGIIASKKVLKRAVERNRGKRLVREVFRSVQRQFGGLDVIVQFRQGLGTRGNDEVREELMVLFSGISRCADRKAKPTSS